MALAAGNAVASTIPIAFYVFASQTGTAFGAASTFGTGNTVVIVTLPARFWFAVTFIILLWTML